MPNESSLTRLSDENMPGNSNASKKKTDIDDERRVKKAVVQSQPVTRKKSLGKKFTETFLGDTLGNVCRYLAIDVFIPAAKVTISDMFSQGIEMLLFGEDSRRGDRRGNERSYTSYSSYYNRNSRNDRTVRSLNRRASIYGIEDIIVGSRGEAQEIIDNLTDLIIDYGHARVADLYDLVGISHNYTDCSRGWSNLNDASYKRVREGYLLELPDPQPIDRKR